MINEYNFEMRFLYPIKILILMLMLLNVTLVQWMTHL